MNGLERAINFLDDDCFVVRSNNIAEIKFDKFVLNDNSDLQYEEVFNSFVRYPYDLIPPHNETFRLRERTEFLKSVCLMLSDRSVNPITKCWSLRNRPLSLAAAQSCGLRVPDWVAISVSDPAEVRSSREDASVVKALGNCFFSEVAGEDFSEWQHFLTLEMESDGDQAFILPATLQDSKNVQKYLALAGAGFVQAPATGTIEVRAYVIGGAVFTFMRDEVPAFDKSSAPYQRAANILQPEIEHGLVSFRERMGLGYLCMDIRLAPNQEAWVIDVNPYGSLPVYQVWPEPTLALAQLLLKEKGVGSD